MKPSRAFFGLAVIIAGCGRSVSSSTPTFVAASSSSAVSETTPPPSCRGRRWEPLAMDVRPVEPAEQQGLEKFLLHVRGCGFTIGAMTWDMRIGDVYSSNGSNGNETDITWSLDKEPVIGDELFIGYGNAKGATGIHYQGLGKISVAATSPHGP